MQRINKLTFFIITLFLTWTLPLSAQMSDDQVLREAMRYHEQGMSQMQIFQELTRKGVSVAQFQRLKEKLNQQQQAQNTSQKSSGTNSTKTLREPADETLYNNNKTANERLEDTIPQKEKIYGQDFFSRENLTFAPNMNMPTPANYVLGAGDEVIIDVWGNSELNAQYTIAPDGHITVPGLGRIPLSGLQVKQAEAKIRSRFSTIYSELNSSSSGTFLGVSVGNVRTINVNVMGEVVQPGTYTLTSFASAFHALYAAGGISSIGSLRHIHIFRNGQTVATVDLYEYLMKGNNMGDITLRDGDIVQVEPYSILVQITGEIKRPMFYEMRPTESMQDLIRFAGGFNGNAYKTNVQMQRKGSEQMQAFTVNDSQYAFFRLQDGDQVEVGNILERFANKVEISGAVYRPGTYAIGDQIRTVKDLIAIAQGTTGDAYTSRVLLYRENDDLTQSMQSFDLNELLSNRIPDIGLKKNDMLLIPSVLSMEEELKIYVGGEVRAPGQYAFATNMNIEDAILCAGGLNESASTARIDVYRRIKNPGSTVQSALSGESYTFSLQEGKIISNNPSFVLHPFDQVVVRRSPGYEVQQNVKINGEVLFGGEYAKLYKNERLSSLVKRAGGVTDYAFIKGARLFRQLTDEELQRTKDAFKTKLRADKKSSDSLDLDSLITRGQYVGIDLEKALKNPGSDDDLVLREGDILSVPEYTNTVKISGGVMYPNTVTYDKDMNLKSYVRQAGGFSRLAMKSKPFVIYMNGKVASGRRAKIEPGCEIVVPERPEREPMSLQGILGISTSLASIALLISNMIK